MIPVHDEEGVNRPTLHLEDKPSEFDEVERRLAALDPLVRLRCTTESMVLFANLVRPHDHVLGNLMLERAVRHVADAVKAVK